MNCMFCLRSSRFLLRGALKPPKNRTSLIIQSTLKTQVANPVKNESGYGQFRYLIAAPLICVGLGTWQIFRLQGKLELIETINSRFFATPIHLREIDFTNNDIKNIEYTHVYVSGEFDHENEMYIDFKQPQMPASQTQWTLATGSISTRGNYGSHIVTPFIVDSEDAKKLNLRKVKNDEPVRILVNRGWVSKHDVSPSKRPEGQVKGKVQISGYIRGEEKKFMNFLIQDNQKPGTYLFREVNNMSKYGNTEPIMIELDEESSVPGGPNGGQTMVKIYNKHAEYIATWYGLAIGTGYLWYKHVYQAKPFARKMFFRK